MSLYLHLSGQVALGYELIQEITVIIKANKILPLYTNIRKMM